MTVPWNDEFFDPPTGRRSEPAVRTGRVSSWRLLVGGVWDAGFKARDWGLAREVVGAFADVVRSRWRRRWVYFRCWCGRSIADWWHWSVVWLKLRAVDFFFWMRGR